MTISKCYEVIGFVNRFKEMSIRHNNFSNRLEGNKKELYDKVLINYGYQFKYSKTENFYKIEESKGDSIFTLHLVLKDGIVEAMLFIKHKNNYEVPDGRFDSICENLDSNFSRHTFPIPAYSSEEELRKILQEVFNIYEDFKKEFLALVEKEK